MIRRSLLVVTEGRGFVDVTVSVGQMVSDSGLSDGFCHLFLRHTSASLIVTENADPDVLKDMERFMAGLVPEHGFQFSHSAEGPDDMPAHVRSALTQVSLLIPVGNRRCMLGTWQGVYLWEHRLIGRQREIVATVWTP